MQHCGTLFTVGTFASHDNHRALHLLGPISRTNGVATGPGACLLHLLLVYLTFGKLAPICASPHKATPILF